jgi:predicted small secreted protein
MIDRLRISGIAAILAVAAFGISACDNTAADAGDDTSVVRGAIDACVSAAPVVIETREETPGPVAPGISKIYFVTVRNADSATCGPATVTFSPDSFHFFSVTAQPNNVGGVAPGATVQFRVTVTSDPSVGATTTVVGFTIIKSSSTNTATARGSVTYVTTFDNPTGCNRHRDPAPVPQGTVVTYKVTVRNVDNSQCGLDTFTLTPTPPNRFENVTTDGPFGIAPQGSATFTFTVQAVALPPGSPLTQCFTVSGAHHTTADLTATDCVRYRTR